MSFLLRFSLVLFFLCYFSFGASLTVFGKASNDRYKKVRKDKNINMLYKEDSNSLRRLVLDNGLVVILKEKHSVPMVAMQLWVRAGSTTEGKNLGSGLSHYFEHMLGKRTKTKDRKEAYYNEIRAMGGADVNAYTSYERTVYHFTVRSEYFSKALNSLSDMIMNSVFDEEESKKEIDVILKEINMKDDNPQRYLWQSLVETVFTTHHYRYPVIGYRDLFKSLGKKDILDYYATMYSPSNMILVLAGDFGLDMAELEARKAFGGFKRKNLPSLYIPQEPNQIEERKVVKEFGINSTEFIMAYPTVNALADDVYALDVLALILGEGKTSRLYKKLKDKEQLVNSVSASSWTPKYKGLFTVSSDLDYKNLDKVIASVKAEIERIKERGISKRELLRARQKVLVSLVYSMQTLGGYARSLAMGEFLGDIDYYSHYLEELNKLSQKDIIKVARKYLKDRYLTTAVLVPKGSLSALSSINSKKSENKKASIKKIKLKNGITLLLNKDKSIPLISLNALFSGGYVYETEKTSGTYNLLFSSLLKGTRKRTAADIAALVEDMGASLQAEGGGNFSSISASFLSGDARELYLLLLDILSNASFPAVELAKVKKDILHDIKTRDDDIWRASRYHLRRLRYAGHSYSFDGFGTSENIERIGSRGLKNLYKKVISPDNMVLSIFGDIDEKMIVKIFSSSSLFTGRKSGIKTPLPPDRLSSRLKDTYYVKEARKQSIIKILFDAPDYYEEDSYPLMLLTYVFSGIGSRLFMDLRDKRGLSYATGGFYQPLRDTGLFLFYIGTEPDKREEAISGILGHIERVKEELIEEGELELAKNSAIGKIIKAMETLSGRASFSSLYEKLGFGYDYYYSLPDKLIRVSREDIKRVANKYFSDSNYALSVVESSVGSSGN